MVYQKHTFSHGTVFPAENDGVWSFADISGDGAQDLVYIKTQNTSTGKIEIHASDYESRFQEHTMNASSVFDIDDNGTYLMQDWNGDGKADLIYIKTRNTDTGTVEVHVADAASGYQNLAFQTGTCFRCDEEDGTWTMSSNGDLFYIDIVNTEISNMNQCYFATKASNYQDRTQYYADARHVGDDRNRAGAQCFDDTQHLILSFWADSNSTWCIAPSSNDNTADLYYISPGNNWRGMVKVYVASEGTWKSHVVKLPSSFVPGENGRWLMVNFTHQNQPDLAYIKTKNTISGKIEVHITSYQEVVPQSYTLSSRNPRLDCNAPSVLRADLQRNDGSSRDASIDLDMFIGNIDGRFTWGKRGFHESAREITFDGSTLIAKLQTRTGRWVSVNIDLKDNLMNDNGVFKAINVPVITTVPREHQNAALSQLSEAMDDPSFKIREIVLAPSRTQAVMYPSGNGSLIMIDSSSVINSLSVTDSFSMNDSFGLPVFHEHATHEPEGTTFFYTNAGVDTGDGVFWTCTGEARASLIHISQSKGRPIEQVHIDVLTTDVSATFGTYVGAEANVSLVKGQASVFDFQLGIGIETDFVGIKDDSVKVEFEDCGFTLGRKVGVSAFGSSFAIDFGRFFS